MYKATVIETFIATPGDVEKEREIIRNVITEWNRINSKSRGIVLKDLGWENDVYSSFSASRPQESINEQILGHSDLLIGVFWTRIGTSTGGYISGSVEEITKHIMEDKPVLLFFSSMPIKPESLDQTQYSKLLEFKNECAKKGLYNEYNTAEEFTECFRNQLGLLMNKEPKILELIENNENSINDNEHKVQLSKKSAQLLKEISQDANGHLVAIMTLRGYQVQTNNKNFGGDRTEVRKNAEINSIIEELESCGLIKANQNHDIFTITGKGFKVADTIRLD